VLDRCRGRPDAWLQRTSRAHVGWRARSRPGVPRAFVEFVDPADEPGDALRPDLADVELHVHLRPGLPGHLRRRPTSAAARSAPTSPTRPTRSGSRRTSPARRPSCGSCSPARKVRRKDWVEPTTRARRKTRTTVVDGQQACVFHNRTDFHLGAACAPARTGLRDREEPGRDQAGRVLAAADPPYLPQRGAPGRHVVHRGHDQRVRPARLGSRRPRPGTGTARATPRRTSAQEPVYITHEAELVELLGRPAYVELVVTARPTCGPASALALHPADTALTTSGETLDVMRRRPRCLASA
jgi:hypothetical protein